MIINEIGMLCLIMYVIWKFWNLQKRAIRIIDNPKEKSIFAIDILYAIIMTYLLVTIDIFFILFAGLSFFFHLTMGLYAELFKPELKSGDVIAGFWRFLILDTFITGSIYFIMIFGGAA